MSAHDIRSLINLLEAIEQDQKPALPKVVAVPQDQLDQLASSLSQSIKLLTKKDLDEAGWRNKLAGAALAAAALGGGAGSADAQSFQSQQQAQRAELIKKAEQEKADQQIRNVQPQVRQQAVANIPLNTLRDCYAVMMATYDRVRLAGYGGEPALELAKQFRSSLMKNIYSSVDPQLAATAVRTEMDLLRNQTAVYSMMPSDQLGARAQECKRILTQATSR